MQCNEAQKSEVSQSSAGSSGVSSRLRLTIRIGHWTILAQASLTLPTKNLQSKIRYLNFLSYLIAKHMCSVTYRFDSVRAELTSGTNQDPCYQRQEDLALCASPHCRSLSRDGLLWSSIRTQPSIQSCQPKRCKIRHQSNLSHFVVISYRKIETSFSVLVNFCESGFSFFRKN